MTTIESIVKEIEDFKERRFSWETGKQRVIDMIGGLHFQGEVDGDILYMALCMTFVSRADGEVHYLTTEEADEYYVTKRVSGLEMKWKPSQWVVAYFHMKKMFLRVMVTETCDVNRTARENFAVAFTQNKDFMREGMNMKPRDEDFIRDKFDIVISDSYEHRRVFVDLAKIIEWSKTHRVGAQNFYEKIYIPMARFFEDAQKVVRDERYAETQPRTIVEKPAEYKKHSLPVFVRSTINGASYDSLFFREEVKFEDEYVDGKVRWTAEENGLSFLWTVIDYVNSGSAKANPMLEIVEKITLSNDWRVGEANSAAFRIAKVNDEIIVELEVRQNGIVYILKRDPDSLKGNE